MSTHSFDQNRVNAIQNVWKDLCDLDNFLRKDLAAYISRSPHLDPSTFEFLTKPFNNLQKHRQDLPYSLYSFAHNHIYIGTVQRDLNAMLDFIRGAILARQAGDKEEEQRSTELLMEHFLKIPANYLIKLNEFREMAARETGSSFSFHAN